MASKLCRNRALASALRPAKPSVQCRGNSSSHHSISGNEMNMKMARCFSTTTSRAVAIPKDSPNLRQAPRDYPKELKVPIVNPADKYQTKADDLHRYGSWLMGCLPKYIQQFSVWKDELTIYIPPSGVIPVFSFLKCKRPLAPWPLGPFSISYTLLIYIYRERETCFY